jgi:RNA polymerase sigma-70 factor (ECF subfamily)
MDLVETEPLLETSDSDGALVERARRGEQPALARLIRRHERNGLATALGLLRDLHQAEEALQEAFCRAWRSLDRLRDPARFKAWFSGILTRVCLDALRARGRERHRPPAARPPAPPGRGGPETSVVEEALELPDDYREPLLLFYVQDLAIAEVAEALGISEANAKVRLHRARKMLRERLERKGIGTPPGDKA